MDRLAVIIMAAGKGTRMKSDLPKVLHRLHGKPMIAYVVQTALQIGGDPVVVVVGHGKEQVTAALEDQPVRIAVQEPQLGTGHAVQCALPHMGDAEGSVLVLSGDVPLIRQDTLRRLVNHHAAVNAAATVLTATAPDPHGYGRIIRSVDGYLEAIVEEKDADDHVRKIDEINSGIYVFEIEDLHRILPRIQSDNVQREYYLTDAVRLLTAEGKTVAARKGDFAEVMGVNTIEELRRAEEQLKTGAL